jgi:3-hydroxymyristoyl/3-hydroxydecanoyl-(acyl carrier protein) dehydratase
VLSIEQWLPHREPFRFVDELIEVKGETAELELRLARDDPRLQNGTLPPLLLVEALAQGAAVFNSYTHPQERESGLLGDVQASLYGPARAGELVRLTVSRLRTHGPLVRFLGRATAEGRLLVEAELTVMREPRGEHA